VAGQRRRPAQADYAAGVGVRTVIIEDLHVPGCSGTRRLARHVADASFGEFRRQLQYKAGVAWAAG